MDLNTTILSARDWASDLLGIIYPNVCEVCGRTLVKGEKVFCISCMLHLPRTHIHDESFGIIHQKLAGHVRIEKAAAYLYYHRESPFSSPIQTAKYRGRPNILRHLANMYVSEIRDSGFFDGIDIIEPVPIHWLKKLKQGYNQSDSIAEGLSENTSIGQGHHLVAGKHGSQTRRNAYQRWINSQNIYKVKNGEELENKHVLIVDDVMTTGATMLACCEAIHSAVPSAKISVLVLAVTRHA